MCRQCGNSDRSFKSVPINKRHTVNLVSIWEEGSFFIFLSSKENKHFIKLRIYLQPQSFHINFFQFNGLLVICSAIKCGYCYRFKCTVVHMPYYRFVVVVKLKIIFISNSHQASLFSLNILLNICSQGTIASQVNQLVIIFFNFR